MVSTRSTGEGLISDSTERDVDVVDSSDTEATFHKPVSPHSAKIGTAQSKKKRAPSPSVIRRTQKKIKLDHDPVMETNSESESEHPSETSLIKVAFFSV